MQQSLSKPSGPLENQNSKYASFDEGHRGIVQCERLLRPEKQRLPLHVLVSAGANQDKIFLRDPRLVAAAAAAFWARVMRTDADYRLPGVGEPRSRGVRRVRDYRVRRGRLVRLRGSTTVLRLAHGLG
jgi:hypothetical protein